MVQARILVVEDEILVAESIRDELIRLGYEVPALVASGEEAVSVAEELQPDLVLMDIELAGEMDGVAAAKEIGERLSIPVVYLTAYADDGTLQRIGIAESFGYLVKPLRAGELRGTIEMALFRHQRDRELCEQNEFLNNVLESLTHPFYVVNADDYTIELANSATGAGIRAGKTTCYAFSHGANKPCDIDAHPCPLEEIRRTGQPAVVEHVHYDKNGGVRHVEVHGYPLFDGEGRIARIIEYSLDITQRKAAEQALRGSEVQWRSLADISPDHIVVLDADLNIEYVNRASPGLTVEELLGTPLYRYVAEERRSEIKKLLEGVLETGESASYETEYGAPDGSTLYYESRVVGRVVHGTISGLVVSAREITKRKRMEEELRKLTRAVDQSPSTVVITDTQGIIEYVNPGFTRVAGYAPDEVIGRNPRLLKSGQQPPEYYQEMWATIVAGKEWHGEFCNRKKNGELYWEIASISPVRDEEGRVTHFVKVAEDITARKKAEEALQQRTIELQIRNEELDAFAHTVAHDLQNPLSLVIGYSELLADARDAMTADELGKYLLNITRSSQKMSRIISELLMLSSVRKADVETMPLDMASIVAEACQRLTHQFEEHQAELILPDTWPDALGYAPWVEEVWSNYLSNAIKYGGQPPRVELGGRTQEDGRVCFWVLDNGDGLTPEERAELFVPFARLAQAQVKGHGLGLSIVRRIVEKLGGQIGVESEGIPGRGSRFTFTLPGATRQTD